MRLLVIGGTVFLGQAFAAEALSRGWEVTTFNRGRSAADLPGVETIRGDRESDEDLARLAESGPWDAVVDVCGYVPSIVGASVAALAGAASSYLFISSVNAYPGFPAVTVDEDSPRHECPADAGRGDGDYGKLKAGCENAVTDGFPGRALIIQPGLIMGPGDRARRTIWWLRRASEGGRMVAPAAPEQQMQLIDARDIAAFGLDRIAAEDSGSYIVTGPSGNATWSEYLGACLEATGDKAEPVWMDDRFLLDHAVEPWSELPLWAPRNEEMAEVWNVSSAKALAAGLRCRPVVDSVRDTADRLFAPGGLEEAFSEYRSMAALPQLSPEKERLLLTDWDARS